MINTGKNNIFYKFYHLVDFPTSAAWRDNVSLSRDNDAKFNLIYKNILFLASFFFFYSELND